MNARPTNLLRRLLTGLPLCLLALAMGGCASLLEPPTAPPAVADVVRPAEPVMPQVAVGSPGPGAANPAGAPEVVAGSALMIDARSGQVLYAKNADQTRPVASTQKLLTALLISEAGDLDRAVTIRPEDTRVEPTKLGLKPGEHYTRRELLGVMMVKSANDAAAALARDHSGSVWAFAAAMNAKARALGATSSRFVNPHGLTEPGQYSTARDMARIAFAAYRDPVLRDFMRRPEYHFRYASGRTVRLEATNELLGRSPMVDGMKTGYTVASGRCLITSARAPGGPVILVQLGSKTKYIFDDADRMVRWGGNGRSVAWY